MEYFEIEKQKLEQNLNDVLKMTEHSSSPDLRKTAVGCSLTRYVNEDANGCIYVSKRPMNQTFYSTPARLKCIQTKLTKITQKGVFAGSICETIDGEILKIVKVKNRNGYERRYITEGCI